VEKEDSGEEIETALWHVTKSGTSDAAVVAIKSAVSLTYVSSI
jgi:hypothetical protein